ncbi:tetratricopeptide repeat protein [Hufsiella ginkgonis]|uniref:Tetratricopeptide repeat protein n=1 Tax=Hufsiella ginkgonis TaxID=2695274 RepID=A0A7K1XXV8_9SPHI|nr:tetratricopeptide repeat protein [Hufsiella ginkgonis]MXV15844.1 tetratricopeptide repeat protein [Hufsiella ginkgonis]
MRTVFPLFACFLVSVGISAVAQPKKDTPKKENQYALIGNKDLLDGKFVEASANLEKALLADSNNVEVLYMLGYSYYHSGNYAKSVASFSKVVSLKPGDGSAYYYRGKARDILATQSNTTLSYAEREKLLQASVKDFTRAIELAADDMKLYQNRAIAYRDLGILKSQKIPKFYDKAVASSAYKSCIADFQKVLDSNPTRQDLQMEMKKARVYLANLDN